MANGGIIGKVNNPTSTTATGVWQQEEQYEAKVTDTWPQRALFTTKSLRFNSGSSDYLVRTMDSAPTLATKATISYWFKRTKLDAWGGMGGYSASSGTGTNNFQIGFNDANYGYFWQNSPALYFYTSAVNRDPSAWKNVVISIDTTQGTASNRVKYYENGIRTTSFVTETYPSQNDALNVNKNGNLFSVGRFTSTGGSQFYYDGYLAETILVDGQQLAPTSFGVANSDGVWTPIPYSGTFGNNGFNLQFENSAALGTDSSPNGNTFTVNNLTSIDQSTDYPVVNYATLNPLYKPYASATFSEGNLKISTATGWSGNKATMGVSQGKWYWEIKLSGTMTDHQHGVQQENVNEGIGNPENTIGTTVFFNQDGGEMKTNGTATTADYGLFSTGDIMGIALDMDSGSYGQITIYKNGTALVSNFNLSSSSTLVMPFSSIVNSTAEYNFGSPPYAISSSNADGNGYGNFEYAPPSGYYALNTANLAEFG